MFDRKMLPNVGRHVYGLGGIALGLVGLTWGDFAAVWQPVPAEFPHRRTLAYITAICFLVAGLATQWRKTARSGLVVLSLLYLGAALLWVPRVVSYPRIFGTWAGVAEQLGIVAGGVAAYASLGQGNSDADLRVGELGRVLFGVCAVMFGLAHFSALPQTAEMVPHWIPPGQRFWAIATGVFHIMAGLAILTRVQAKVASRLETAMIIGFGVLVWAPSLVSDPKVHMVWAGNSVNLALVGAAWAVADWLNEPRGLRAL
ncbi:MAG: hypothetical protein H0X25_10265 [Acidobacteriales bacterium]|nr:hypothetical protein [Terriglobales bacterium]